MPLVKGKRFWCGSVNLLDGTIEEVHTYEEAKEYGFHHSLYFSTVQCEKIANNECAFFWVDNEIVFGEWREEIKEKIIKQINNQITFEKR